jgi:hypothetical protein
MHVPLVVAAFANGDEFLAAYDVNRGDLVVRTRAELGKNAPVVAEIGWPQLASRVPVRAHARRRWFRHDLALRVIDEDRPKVEFLERVALGYIPVPASRRHLRYCVRLPIKWRRFGGSELCDGFAEDLSAGGVLLVTRVSDVTAGDCVAIRLWPEPHATDLVVTGEVRRMERRNDGRLVLGVAFDYRESAEHRSLRGLLRSYSAHGTSPASFSEPE